MAQRRGHGEAGGIVAPTGGSLGGPAARHRCLAPWILLGLLLHLAPPLTRPAAADEAAPFRLCVEVDNPPFGTADGAMPGVYVELGRRIADRLGRLFEPVWIRGYFGKRTVRTTLLAGQCDGFIGLPDTPDFMGMRLIFSKPVLRLGYALVVPRGQAPTGLSDLTGRRVAVQFASPPQSHLAGRADVQPVTALSPEEAMGHLVDGRADAAFVWGPTAGWLNKTAFRDAYEVIPVEGDHMQWSAAIGFARGQEALRDQIDKTLDGVAGSVEALKAKYGFPDAAPLRLAGAGEGASAAAAGITNPGSTPGASPGSIPAPTPPSGRDQAPTARTASDTAGNADEAAAGHKLFNETCSHCHGPDAVQGERRRNLRLLRRRHGDEMERAFMATVTQGRANKGMPSWSGVLSDDQLHAILAFLHTVQER